MNGDLDKARKALAAASQAVAFTGAGISAESGIRTFRGDDGLWNEIDIEQFATPWGVKQLVETEPQRYARYLGMRARILSGAAPNPAHFALADLEAAGKLAGVVTQNIDGLHEAAGTQTIYKLHGDVLTWHCLDCGAQQRFSSAQVIGFIDAVQPAMTKEQFLALAPKCPACFGLIRPTVVLFGEMLPDAQVVGAERLLAKAECLLIVGTSGVVEPAASFARTVARRGVPTIEINLEPSELTRYATVSLFGKAGEILPELVT